LEGGLDVTDIAALERFLTDHAVRVQQILPDAPRLEEAFVYLMTQVGDA